MIDISYFAWRDVRVPNITDQCKDRNIYFIQFMKRMERECLRLVLGNCLYDELQTQLDTDGNLLTTADAKWSNLLFGETYDDSVSSRHCSCSDCDKLRWRGIYNVEDKRSLVAFYIFYEWSVENESQVFSTGNQVADVANSTTVPNEMERIAAYNEFVAWTQNGYACNDVSLYQYLCDKETDFPEHQGHTLRYKTLCI